MVQCNKNAQINCPIDLNTHSIHRKPSGKSALIDRLWLIDSKIACKIFEAIV